MPPHLRHVATLPCEIFMFKKHCRAQELNKADCHARLIRLIILMKRFSNLSILKTNRMTGCTHLSQQREKRCCKMPLHTISGRSVWPSISRWWCQSASWNWFMLVCFCWYWSQVSNV